MPVGSPLLSGSVASQGGAPFLTYTHTWAGNADIQSNEADFDGTGDWLTIAGTSAIEAVFDGTGDWTIELDTHSDASQVSVIFGQGYGDAGWTQEGDTTFQLAQINGDILWNWNSGLTSRTLQATGGIEAGTTRITIVRDASRVSLYVGTSRIGTETANTNIDPPSGAGSLVTIFGASSGLFGNPYNGQVDEVRVSGIARYDATATSITNLSMTNDADVVYLNTFTGANGSTPTLNTES